VGETRKYRKFTAQQKTELVLASLRGQKSMTELCREHDISDSLLRKWREPRAEHQSGGRAPAVVPNPHPLFSNTRR